VSAATRKAGSSNPTSVLAAVPSPLAKTCLAHLDAHLAAGLRSHLVKSGLAVCARGGGVEAWLTHGAGKGLLQQLRDALQAASLLLCFLTADGVDPKLVRGLLEREFRCLNINRLLWFAVCIGTGCFAVAILKHNS
jgi:hypothetical protein